jgi:hypothetical protein
MLMIAYTAWDSLRAIAREYDADLTLDARGDTIMAQRWERCSAVIATRRLSTQVRESLSAFRPAPTPRA